MLDFGAALEHRPAILKEAREFHETWKDILSFVSDEVDAFNALAALAPEGVPADFVAEHKRKAAAEHDWFASQRRSRAFATSSAPALRWRRKFGQLAKVGSTSMKDGLYDREAEAVLG